MNPSIRLVSRLRQICPEIKVAIKVIFARRNSICANGLPSRLQMRVLYESVVMSSSKSAHPRDEVIPQGSIRLRQEAFQCKLCVWVLGKRCESVLVHVAMQKYVNADARFCCLGVALEKSA